MALITESHQREKKQTVEARGGGVFMKKYCREKKEQKKAIVIDKVR